MHNESNIKIATLCKIAGITRSTYYFEINKKDSDDKNGLIIQHIKDIFIRHHRNYGVRRVYHELKNSGVNVNHKKVQRIMRKFNLTARKHPRKYHSYQGTVGVVAKNLLNRNFYASLPNQKWTTDVSQFSFTWGKCYLSPIMDMFNNEIISYDLSTSPNFEQIERMLNKADIPNKKLNDLVIHSDQGWQYQNPRYVAKLKSLHIRQSMSRKGNCYDNCIMESFFGLMKNEIYYGKENTINSYEDFKKIVADYISYYNNCRIKSKTSWMSPIQYRISSGL